MSISLTCRYVLKLWHKPGVIQQDWCLFMFKRPKISQESVNLLFQSINNNSSRKNNNFYGYNDGYISCLVSCVILDTY